MKGRLHNTLTQCAFRIVRRKCCSQGFVRRCTAQADRPFDRAANIQVRGLHDIGSSTFELRGYGGHVPAVFWKMSEELPRTGRRYAKTRRHIIRNQKDIPHARPSSTQGTWPSSFKIHLILSSKTICHVIDYG